jgi:hypothetical protein
MAASKSEILASGGTFDLVQPKSEAVSMMAAMNSFIAGMVRMRWSCK